MEPAYLSGLVVASLLGINAFLSRRLFSRIEIMVENFPVMARRLESVEKEVKEVKRDVHDLVQVRERVAVLEYALKRKEH